MLVLKRRKGQSILIGGGIKITVVDYRKGGVLLGFEAPPEVRILREELGAAAYPRARARGVKG
jgi:carbon storage regulator